MNATEQDEPQKFAQNALQIIMQQFKNHFKEIDCIITDKIFFFVKNKNKNILS